MMALEFTFDEKKATQTAAEILLRFGSKYDYLSLVKLLYIIDREAMRSWGHPIAGGPYFSLPAGPVNSPVLKVVNNEIASLYWNSHIERVGNSLTLKSAPGKGRLSRDEVDLIQHVCDLWGQLSTSELVNMTHDFKEWVDPNGSSAPIQTSEILSAVGKSPEEILAIESDAAAATRMKQILG